MDKQPKYTCNDYRQEMILLSLRLRLTKESLTESEKEAIKIEIRQIEASMGMK
jgi:hypothetical protein